MDAHPRQVRRDVPALIVRGLAAEETVLGIRGIGWGYRIYARRGSPPRTRLVLVAERRSVTDAALVSPAELADWGAKAHTG